MGANRCIGFGEHEGICSYSATVSAKAGRLVRSNPFAELGISKGAGRRDQQPPTEEMIWRIIGHARDVTSPDFAAWLQLGAFTGMRPGEIDALDVYRR